MPPSPKVRAFWDEPTGSWQYVFHDPETRRGAIVDPVWDYDPCAGALRPLWAERILAHVEAERLTIDWILDTHPHADHFTAASWLQERLGAPIAIGAEVGRVQKLWAGLYGDETLEGGAQWDRLWHDGDTFQVGEIPVRALFTPGHTLCSIAYVAGNAAFVHDTLMMPDAGTSRCDFPGGDARQQWTSIQRLLSLPDQTRLFVGHDYAPGRPARCEATVAEQKARNIHLCGDATEASYVAVRENRDRTLPLPRLMLAALQVNLRGGRLPEADAEGRRFLRIPLGRFEPR